MCSVQARKMLVLLPDIMENLLAASSDIRMKALMLFINVIPHMKREEAKLIALRLAEKLLLLFDDVRRELELRRWVKDVQPCPAGSIWAGMSPWLLLRGLLGLFPLSFRGLSRLFPSPLLFRGLSGLCGR